MKEHLNLVIETDEDGCTNISIYNSERGDSSFFTVEKDVNCRKADKLAKQIGYEILSWVDSARENMA